MKFKTRCLPLGMLPYENIETTTKMVAKLFDILPFLPLLPNMSQEDSIIHRTLNKIPGIRINEKNVEVKLSSNSYKNGIAILEKAFNKAELTDLDKFSVEAPFLEKYFQMIKKFKPSHAVINLLGPFTISQLIMNALEEDMLTDKSYRKLFIQAVCVKALWLMKKILEINPGTTLIIMLEEPSLGQFGVLKRENEEVTVDLVTTLFTRVIEKLKEHGAIVGIQCMDKCDWKIPIAAGVDIISFDAYNNPNNLCIIPEQVTEFIARGGKINWGIVPVMTESIVKSLNIDYVSHRLFSTMEGLILAGVPERFVYNSALVSIQGDVNKLPLIFAEKAIILAHQLSKRIPIKN